MTLAAFLANYSLTLVVSLAVFSNTPLPEICLCSGLSVVFLIFVYSVNWCQQSLAISNRIYFLFMFHFYQFLLLYSEALSRNEESCVYVTGMPIKWWWVALFSCSIPSCLLFSDLALLCSYTADFPRFLPTGKAILYWVCQTQFYLICLFFSLVLGIELDLDYARQVLYHWPTPLVYMWCIFR